MERKTKAESDIRKRYQTTIPQEIRDKASLSIGDTLLWMYDDIRKEIIVMPKPKRFTDEIFGLGKELWNEETIDDEVRKERDKW